MIWDDSLSLDILHLILGVNNNYTNSRHERATVVYNYPCV